MGDNNNSCSTECSDDKVSKDEKNDACDSNKKADAEEAKKEDENIQKPEKTNIGATAE